MEKWVLLPFRRNPKKGSPKKGNSCLWIDQWCPNASSEMQHKVQSDTAFTLFALGRPLWSTKRRTSLVPSSHQIFLVYVTAPGIQQIFKHNHHWLSTWDTGLGILYSVSWFKLICMKIPGGRYFYSNFTAKECAAQSNLGALNKCHAFPFCTGVTISRLLCSRVRRHTGDFHCLRLTDARIRTNLLSLSNELTPSRTSQVVVWFKLVYFQWWRIYQEWLCLDSLVRKSLFVCSQQEEREITGASTEP